MTCRFLFFFSDMTYRIPLDHSHKRMNVISVAAYLSFLSFVKRKMSTNVYYSAADVFMAY